MKQLLNFGDTRNQGFCVHCGGPPETRDHSPSRIFLDEPYPDNLPVSPSCKKCNQGFSRHEEYFACVLECVVCGTTEPEKLTRSKISAILRRKPALRQAINSLRWEQPALFGRDDVRWNIDEKRVCEVVVKLARCHAAYEQNEPQLDEPDHCLAVPLPTMTNDQRDHFETYPALNIWPEVGSRAMHRVLIGNDEAFQEGWITVQEGRYRYMAVSAGGLMVRGVLSEYLAYEVIWN